MNDSDLASLKPILGGTYDMSASVANDDDDELMEELLALQAEDTGLKRKKQSETTSIRQIERTSATKVQSAPFCQQSFVMPNISRSLLQEITKEEEEDTSDNDMDFLNDSDLLSELSELVKPDSNFSQQKINNSGEEFSKNDSYLQPHKQENLDAEKRLQKLTDKQDEVMSDLAIAHAHNIIPPPVLPRSSSIQKQVILEPEIIRNEANVEHLSEEFSLANRAQSLLLRRRKLYLDVAKAAKAANDRTSAVEAFGIVKMFNEALDAMKQGAQLCEEDLEQIPPSPKPYSELTFSKQNQATMGNKITQNLSNDINSEGGNNTNEGGNSQLKTPIVDSIELTQGWMSDELRLVLTRQMEFKKAALTAKQLGDIQTAKEYLIKAHSMDQMVEAAKCGIPIDIQQIPNIPSNVKIINNSDLIKKGTVDLEILKKCQLLEKEFLKQIDFCARNIVQFQSLNDTKNLLLYEGLQHKCMEELRQIQLAMKGQAPIPHFKLVELTLPKIEINPAIPDDQIQLKISKIENLKLPTGWKPCDLYLYIFYKFPYPHGEPQSGKTSIVKGTNSPEFTECFQLKINRRTKQLARICQRVPLKLEIYQKGGFLRSDKLFGHADIPLKELEQKATIQGEFDILDGRKKTGGYIFVEIRISKPLAHDSTGAEVSVGIKRKWVKLEL